MILRLRNWFKRKTDKPPTEDDLLHGARMESLREKIKTSDEIIEMMKDFTIERRMLPLNFKGPDRRHG